MEIPAEVYKHGGYILTRRLHLLIQNIWEQGTLPQDWKDANIVVIYKQKGDRAVCGNTGNILQFYSHDYLGKSKTSCL